MLLEGNFEEAQQRIWSEADERGDFSLGCMLGKAGCSLAGGMDAESSGLRRMGT